MFVKLAHLYQKKAVKFLLDNPYSGLFLDPGLGKTAVSLLYIKLIKKYFGIKKTLIIAPKRVCYITWPDEINNWPDFKGLTYTVLHGPEKNKRLEEDVDIYLINPEGLKWLTGKLKNNREHDFDVLIIDESTKFKNWTAKRTRMLLKMLKFFKRRHILTGTPSPRSLIDLFSQAFILDMGNAFGNAITRFRDAYFNYDKYKYKYEIKDGCDTIIHNKMAPLVLQMSAEDYLDLPDLIQNKIFVELDCAARSIYEEVEEELFTQIEDDSIHLINGSAAYNACKQIASGALYHQKEFFPTGIKVDKERKYYIVHDEKIDALQELLDELNGKPLLIAYAFNHDLERLLKRWPGTRFIGKGVSDEEAVKIVEDWNKGKIDKLFCQPASMSHGLNMQKQGGDICWFSMTDNLEEYDQFVKRIHRQGVPASVTNHHIIVKGTTDIVMYNRNIQKGKVQDSLRLAIKNYMIEKNL
jgi:SNF2 family DNA or RNA helicase